MSDTKQDSKQELVTAQPQVCACMIHPGLLTDGTLNCRNAVLHRPLSLCLQAAAETP
jgi:hypothetical protein